MQDQYPAYQIQAHVPQHGPKYEHKNVPFEGTTTNQDAYKAYAVEPHRAMHAPVVARPYTKFEGTCSLELPWVLAAMPVCCDFAACLCPRFCCLHPQSCA